MHCYLETYSLDLKKLNFSYRSIANPLFIKVGRSFNSLCIIMNAIEFGLFLLVYFSHCRHRIGNKVVYDNSYIEKVIDFRQDFVNITFLKQSRRIIIVLLPLSFLRHIFIETHIHTRRSVCYLQKW